MRALFKIIGFVMMMVVLAAGPVRAQILEDEEILEGPLVYSMNVSDVLWWEEVETKHILPNMEITLKDKAVPELVALVGNHVGEEMELYFDGKYITTLQIPDTMQDGIVRFRYDGETQARLQPLLPMRQGEKPVVRVIKR